MTKMERELEVQDSAQLRRKRKSWAKAVRESKRHVREATAHLKSERRILTSFSDGLCLVDKILARRKRKSRASSH